MYKQSFYNDFVEIDNQKYVFNTVSGAKAKIDDKMENTLKSQAIDLTGYDEKTIENLKNYNFIVDENIDEYKSLVEGEKNILNKDSDSLSFVIAPTLRCNFKCYYCFESRTAKGDMSPEIVQDVIEYLKNKLTPNIKSLNITWFGGEPLVAQGIIEQISSELIDYCEAKGIKYNARIITNGFYLTGENAKLLHDKYKLSHAQITLDGYKEDYEKAKGVILGTYDRVVNNIKQASNYIRVSVRLNIIERDYYKLQKFTDILINEFKDYQNVKIYLAEVCEDWSTDGLEKFRKSSYYKQKNIFDNYILDKQPRMLTNRDVLGFRGNPCGLIKKSNAVIGPKGELYRCEHMIGREEEIIGTCKDGLYNNAADNKFKNFTHPKKCSECKYFPICMTGCPNDILECKFERIDCEEKIKSIKNMFIRDIIS